MNANGMVANELTIYIATNISFLVTNNSGLVAITATSFLYVEVQSRLFKHTLRSSRKPY